MKTKLTFTRRHSIPIVPSLTLARVAAGCVTAHAIGVAQGGVLGAFVDVCAQHLGIASVAGVALAVVVPFSVGALAEVGTARRSAALVYVCD